MNMPDIAPSLNLRQLAELTRRPAAMERSAARFWDDPYIARQMLKAHLDPNTDAASRLAN